MLNNKIKGITSLIGSILTHLLIGNILGFGNFIPYLDSYFHHYGNKINDKLFYFISPIGVAISDILPIVVNYLDNFFQTRFLLLFSMFFLLISQLIFYSFITNFKMLILSYFLFGICKGFTYLPLMKNCWKYFPNKKGLITGLILSAFGLSAFIFVSICDAMVNPSNKSKSNDGYYEKAIADKFIDFILLYIYIIVIIGIIVIILVFPFEEENINEKIQDNEYLKFGSLIPKESGSNEEQISNSIEKQSLEITKQEIKEKEIYPSLSECLFSNQFYICLITVGCTTIFGFLLTNTYRNFGNKKFKEREQAIKNLSKSYTLINTFGRILWGIILDTFGFTIPYFIVCLIQIICSAFFYYSANNIYTYFLVCCFGAFSFAGHATLFPNVINKKFGVENSVVLLGICGIFNAISCILGPILTFYIIKKDSDYMFIYFITCATGIVSFILTGFIEYKKFEIKNK